MSRDSTLKRILDGGIVAVVRSDTSEPLVKVIEALAQRRRDRGRDHVYRSQMPST